MRHLEKLLLECGAVRLSPDHPFTLRDGRISPIYLDGKAPARKPVVSPAIIEAYQEEVHKAWKQDGEPLYFTILGTSGASTWVSVVASTIVNRFPEMYKGFDKVQGVPYSWIREVQQSYGLYKWFDGALPSANNPVVVIEDVINTGHMSSKAIMEVKQMSAQPLALVALMDYGFSAAKEVLEETKVPVKVLTTIDGLIAAAEENGYINARQRLMIEEWRHDPDNWRK